MTAITTTIPGLTRPSLACIMPRVFDDRRQNLKSIADTGIVSFNLEAIRDRCAAQSKLQDPKDLVRSPSQLALRWDHKSNRATLHVLGGMPDWAEGPDEERSDLIDGGMVFTKIGLTAYCGEVLGGHGLQFIDRLYAAGKGAGNEEKAADLCTLNAYMLSRPLDKRMLQLRTVRTRGTGGTIVRAVRGVFRDYTPFDDIDCLNALLDCPNTRDLPVISYRRGDDAMRIRFAMGTNIDFKVDQPIPMGSLRNSETGRSSIWWEGGAFFPYCTNGLGTNERGANHSWRHTGRRSRIVDGLPQAVREAQVKATGLVEQYGQAMGTAMDNAAEWMRSQLAGFKVGDTVVDEAVKALNHPLTTPGHLLTSVVDAVTWVAQNQADQLRQRELEVIGGQLLRRGLDSAVNGRVAWEN